MENNTPSTFVSRLASWLLVVAWAGFIFMASAHTGADLDDGAGLLAAMKRWLVCAQAALFGSEANVDLVSSAGHFCEYLVLGALLHNALSRNVPAGRAVALAVLIASAYGATDEIHQLFVPGRMCDPVDWLVDTVGSLAGAVAFYGLFTRPRDRRSALNRDRSDSSAR